VFKREQSQTANVPNFDLQLAAIPSLTGNSKLLLVVSESVLLLPGTVFEIFPYGLRNSTRKDACVYAGSLSDPDSGFVNDILLPAAEKGVGKKHFMIKYDSGHYLLKDLGDGMGTFVKLEKELVLQNNFIICFGDSHMLIKLEEERVLLSFIDGPRIDEQL
jgi:hypothetical protein